LDKLSAPVRPARGQKGGSSEAALAQGSFSGVADAAGADQSWDAGAPPPDCHEPPDDDVRVTFAVA